MNHAGLRLNRVQSNWAWPDQVGPFLKIEKDRALGDVGALLRDARFAPIISTVQSDGIEKVVPILGRAIAQRFAIHEIARHGLETLGGECVEGFWICTVPAMIPLKRKRGNEDPASCLRIGNAGKESLSASGPPKASLPEPPASWPKSLSRGAIRRPVCSERKGAHLLPCRTSDRAA